MGNGIGKLTVCFTGAGEIRRRHDLSILLSNPLDEGLGHSFCYVRPDPTRLSSSKVHSEEETTTFRTISGASVSANTSTPLSTAFVDPYVYNTIDRAAAFESSTSFSSIPLQPIPKSIIGSVNSGHLTGNIGLFPGSGPVDRGFTSGPIERGFMSGPLDRGLYSGPIENGSSDKFQRSFSHGGFALRSGKRSLIRVLQRAISKKISRGKKSIVAPIKGGIKEPDWILNLEKQHKENLTVSSVSLEDYDSLESQNVHWAQGKAGEDRVHVVVSDEHGWVFVGIYDGFNGPDATDFLSSNLYSAVHKELKGLLWDDNFEQLNRSINNSDVLKALSEALKKTEEAYFDIADKMFDESPELALMGSCVLVMLMKGEDVYVMNVGDSRAVLGQKAEIDYGLGKNRQDLERINDESLNDLENYEFSRTNSISNLTAFQLTVDHSTNVEEEIRRIKNEHPDDACAVLNDRVKGSLKVTRAFGAGFLKQPKWNNALLEMFRIDYIGNSPYINCVPSLFHHRLGPKDWFLILTSDGLYQYFTNEEAVNEVKLFIALQPEGDPAQHLVEEVLFRAAKKSGMDFYELLEIPQGDRRRYHDDISIIVISLEGRIWRSCV